MKYLLTLLCVFLASISIAQKSTLQIAVSEIVYDFKIEKLSFKIEFINDTKDTIRLLEPLFLFFENTHMESRAENDFDFLNNYPYKIEVTPNDKCKNKPELAEGFVIDIDTPRSFLDKYILLLPPSTTGKRVVQNLYMPRGEYFFCDKGAYRARLIYQPNFRTSKNSTSKVPVSDVIISTDFVEVVIN